jgi:hypothetical protein
MRSDINWGAFVQMPKGLFGSAPNSYGAPGAVTTTAASQPQARQQAAFSGVFLVTQVHHVGNFRGTSGEDWATVFDAVLQPVPAPPPAPAPSAPNTPRSGPS